MAYIKGGSGGGGGVTDHGALTGLSDDDHPQYLKVADLETSSILNSTKWNGANKTVSTSPPSGGANGDIWFQYTP